MTTTETADTKPARRKRQSRQIPEAFQSDPAELVAKAKSKYRGRDYDARMDSLPKIEASEVRIRNPGDKSDEEDNRFSGPIAELTRLPRKYLGFLRDCNVEEPHEQRALRSLIALSNDVLNAECNNRDGRWQAEEERAGRWLARMSAADQAAANKQLNVWSQADAYMHRCVIVLLKYGSEEAEPLRTEYKKMRKQRMKAEADSTTLPSDAKQYFDCRKRQLEIARERAHDLAMGYPVLDFTELKRKLADNGDIHDLAPEMPWPWRTAYEFGMVSMAAGHDHREMIMGMYAQELPRPEPPPWSAMPPYGWGPYAQYGPGAPPMDADGNPDNRKSILGIKFGGNKQEEQQQQANQGRRGGRRR